MNEENEKLRELVFMAIGEASMCWSEVPSGVFESTRAKKIGDKLMEGISRHQSNPIDPDYNKNKVAMNGHGIPVCPECGTKIEACGDCDRNIEIMPTKGEEQKEGKV